MPTSSNRMPMTATASAHATSTVESEVARIRAPRQGAALRRGAWRPRPRCACEYPRTATCSICSRSASASSRRIADALATLEQLERFHPGYSRLYQERGHCYVALKDAPQAIEAFLQAVAINPALPASWSMLEGLYRMGGDADNAGRAAAHVATLKTLPPEVITATGLFCDGDLAAAEKMIRAFLLRHGDHIEAMRLLARIGAALEVFDDAELLLGAVLERVPDYSAARHDYASVLLERHKYSRGPDRARQAAGRRSGESPNTVLWRATAVVGLGDHARAISLYEDLLREAPPRSPNAAELHLSIAHSLKTLGRQRDAIDEYRAATRERAGFRGRVLEPRQSQDLPLHGRRARAHARRGGCADDRPRRPLSPVFRARQGLRGPRRIRRVVALLRARQRAEARREPLPPGSARAQHGEPEARSAPASSSQQRTG